jgi:hypothetical protein
MRIFFNIKRISGNLNRLIWSQIDSMKQILLIALTIILLDCGCSKSDNKTGGSYSHDRATGASANDLLSSARYISLKIEIQYMPGFEPDVAAINHLSGFLSSRLNKPGGIEVIQKQIPAAAGTVLSAQDVRNIEKQNRTVYTSGNQLAVYFLFTNGKYSTDKVLGIAYQNTSMCLFGKTVHENSGGVGQASRSKLEATVMEHEFAHILGLVNTGTSMQTAHQDAAHGAHCNNENCLMYYAAETTDILGFLVTGNIPSLDASCINDLNANGGK